MKKGKIELAVQLTYGKLGNKLGDVESEILEGYGLIGVVIIVGNQHILKCCNL